MSTNALANENSEATEGFRLTNQLAVACTLSAIVALATLSLSWYATRIAANQHRPASESLLRSELAARKDRLTAYLNAVSRDVQHIANAHVSEQIVAEFQNGFSALGESAESSLQEAYIAANPNPIGRKHALLDALDGSEYSRAHATYHEWFTDFALTHDFYDLFVVSPSGDILYTVFKEYDFATNLKNGTYKDTALADLFAELEKDPRPGSILTNDFAEYEPSNFAPAAFVGTPLTTNNEFSGALVVQLKAEPLHDLMRKSRMMGESGSAYIVGPDLRLRSTSRYVPGTNVLKTVVDSASVNAALNNESGVLQITDSRGVDVLSAHEPFTWQNFHWALLVEMEQREVDRPVTQQLRQLLLLSLACTISAFIIGWFLADPRSRQE